MAQGRRGAQTVLSLPAVLLLEARSFPQPHSLDPSSVTSACVPGRPRLSRHRQGPRGRRARSGLARAVERWAARRRGVPRRVRAGVRLHRAALRPVRGVGGGLRSVRLATLRRRRCAEQRERRNGALGRGVGRRSGARRVAPVGSAADRVGGGGAVRRAGAGGSTIAPPNGRKHTTGSRKGDAAPTVVPRLRARTRGETRLETSRRVSPHLDTSGKGSTRRELSRYVETRGAPSGGSARAARPPSDSADDGGGEVPASARTRTKGPPVEEKRRHREGLCKGRSAPKGARNVTLVPSTPEGPLWDLGRPSPLRPAPAIEAGETRRRPAGDRRRRKGALALALAGATYLDVSRRGRGMIGAPTLLLRHPSQGP